MSCYEGRALVGSGRCWDLEGGVGSSPAVWEPGLVGGISLTALFPHIPGIQGPHIPGPKGLHHENVPLRGPGLRLGEISFDVTQKL